MANGRLAAPCPAVHRAKLRCGPPSQWQPRGLGSIAQRWITSPITALQTNLVIRATIKATMRGNKIVSRQRIINKTFQRAGSQVSVPASASAVGVGTGFKADVGHMGWGATGLGCYALALSSIGSLRGTFGPEWPSSISVPMLDAAFQHVLRDPGRHTVIFVPGKARLPTLVGPGLGLGRRRAEVGFEALLSRSDIGHALTPPHTSTSRRSLQPMDMLKAR